MTTDEEDVEARWRDSLRTAARSAYRAARGRERRDEVRGVRWRLDGRVAAAAIGAVALLLAGASLRPTGRAEPTIILDSAAGGGEVVVHVAGAVASPGVVVLDAGARVGDAVDAAGGFAAEADESALNLARFVSDGEQVFVPVVGEADPRVNLNRAGEEELESLPGIGPVLAERIVADRAANGPFRSVDDLARVPGIGDAVVDEIAALVTW